MRNHLLKLGIVTFAFLLSTSSLLAWAVEAAQTKSDGISLDRNWSAPLDDDLATTQSSCIQPKLQAVVHQDVFVSPVALITELTEEAVQKDARTIAIQKRDHRYRKGFRRIVSSMSDMAQFLTAYKGFEGSSEAADVILEEKLKLKSKAAVEYAKQKQLDETHLKVVAAMMQIAMGLGLNDTARGSAVVHSGITNLESLVGEDQAITVFQKLISWAQTVRHSPQVIVRGEWDVLQIQSNTEKVVDQALQNDPVIREIRSALHKYNHKSKFVRAAGKIVNTSLGIAMLSPTIISPAAQLALLGFVAVTGGPEEAKLLTELYLDRRFESRWRRANQESTLAVSNYNTARLTNNTVLAAFCENLITSMAGKASLAELLNSGPHVNNNSSSVASTHNKISF